MKASWLKKKMHILWIAPVLGVLVVAWIDHHISSSTRDRLFSKVSAIPDKPVALVLGTGKYVQGRTNLFYNYRIEAAARTLAFLDMNILGTEPRFLGNIEDVPLKPL
jgi:vancomycin permeability regulator SanA